MDPLPSLRQPPVNPCPLLAGGARAGGPVILLFFFLSLRAADSTVAGGGRDDNRANQEDVHERKEAHEDQGAERCVAPPDDICHGCHRCHAAMSYVLLGIYR